jgi:hypothetical protein
MTASQPLVVFSAFAGQRQPPFSHDGSHWSAIIVLP